jgi:hypothetical protein
MYHQGNINKQIKCIMHLNTITWATTKLITYNTITASKLAKQEMSIGIKTKSMVNGQIKIRNHYNFRPPTRMITKMRDTRIRHTA